MDYYTNIAKALTFIEKEYYKQPNLQTVARHIGVSEFYLQKLFTSWAGISPKKFLQYVSIEHAKNILKTSNGSLINAAYKVGLSSESRLHDMFVNIEGMTPGEYKQNGKNIEIDYSFGKSAFGKYLVASTHIGICNIFFYDFSEYEAEGDLKSLWPEAKIVKKVTNQHLQVKKFFERTAAPKEKIKLHLRGTPFQLKVWQALLQIPEGKLASYEIIAKKVEKPTAARAVGNAIGNNPIAFLIPCHRVIKNSGIFGNYRWGKIRKFAMIGFELASIQKK